MCDGQTWAASLGIVSRFGVAISSQNSRGDRIYVEETADATWRRVAPLGLAQAHDGSAADLAFEHGVEASGGFVEADFGDECLECG